MFQIFRIFAVLSVVTALSIVSIQSGHAAVQSTLQTMSILKTNLVTLQEEADNLLAINERLNEDNALWQEQLGRITLLKNDFQLRVDASEAKEARLTAEVARHNSGCTGEVEEPIYNKCMNEKAVLDPLIVQLTTERNALIEEEIELAEEWNSYVNLMDENSRTISANFNRHLQIQKDYAEIWGELEYQRGLLIEDCANADTDRDGEALQYCNSISWDGTNNNLPALEQILNGTQFFSQ